VGWPSREARVRVGEAIEPQPMMNDPQKSDSPTVATKSANKPEGAGAESMERRGGAEGNPFELCTCRIHCRGNVSPGLERVRIN
jgi:hypothetical protein